MRDYLKVLSKHDPRVWYLVALRFTVVGGFSASMVFFALYLHGELNVPMETVGLLIMMSTLTGAPGQVLGGAVSDRVGRRNLIIYPLLGRALLFLLMSYLVTIGAHYIYLAISLVFVRILGSFFLASSDAMLADVTPSADRVEGYSLVRIGGNLGWAAGPALGGFMAERSYALLFAFTAVSAILAALLTWWGLPESLGSGSRRPLSAGDLRLMGRDRSFMTLFTGALLVFIVMGHMVVPLSIFSVEWVGITKIQFGYLCMLNGLLVVLLQHPIALLLRRRPITPVLITATFMYGVGYFLMGGAHSFVWLAACLVFITLAEVSFAPTALALASRLAPEDSKGRYMGAFGLARVTGWALAPMVGGLLLGRLPGRPYAVWGTVAVFAAAALLIFVLGRERINSRLALLAEEDRRAEGPEIPVIDAAAALTGVGPAPETPGNGSAKETTAPRDKTAFP